MTMLGTSTGSDLKGMGWTVGHRQDSLKLFSTFPLGCTANHERIEHSYDRDRQDGDGYWGTRSGVVGVLVDRALRRAMFLVAASPRY